MGGVEFAVFGRLGMTIAKDRAACTGRHTSCEPLWATPREAQQVS